MAPPTATFTETPTSTNLPAIHVLKAHGESSNKETASENAQDLIGKYVLYHESPEAFDFPAARVKVEGPSPWADKPDEGSSVLKSYDPVRSTGTLDRQYKYTEVTPRLGREYKDAKLSDIIKDDMLLQDLAATIAERGVVFFHSQGDMTVALQKKLTLALGRAAGNPESSGLHIHPTALAAGVLKDDGKVDSELALINSQLRARLYSAESGQKWSKGSDTVFHSDITFEPIPAGFSVLRMVETPSGNGTPEELSRSGGGAVGGGGGDTLWANGYALAEKVSPSFLAYLETLKGEFYQPLFKNAAEHQKIPLYTGPRGAPENVGDYQTAVHPLVRTNPTTGWKSIFAIGSHFHRVIGVTDEESELIKQYLSNLLYTSPEIQLRYKWESNDIAIWDNRSTYHSAIVDLYNLRGEVESRTGIRTLSTGERPFFDPKSKTQTEGLLERIASEKQ